MAGSWIKLRTNLDTDPRVVNVAASTGQHVRMIVGCLHFLWSLADEHTTNGKLTGYTVASLDHMTVAGFAAALQHPAVKWLEVDTDGFIRIPDFKKHNGESAKRRARNAVRAATLRDNPRAQKGARNAHETSTERAPRAEQSRAESDREQSREDIAEKSNALPVVAFKGDACSLLQSAGFDDGAINAILGTAGVDECRVHWALERWTIESKAARAGRRKPIRSNQGYIRKLITGHEKVPETWRTEWLKRRLNESALKLTGAAS